MIFQMRYGVYWSYTYQAVQEVGVILQRITDDSNSNVSPSYNKYLHTTVTDNCKKSCCIL